MKHKPYSIYLWILFVLFCFRVSAQLIQFFFDLPFIPPFNVWQSGTLPYYVLVIFQIIIIVIYLRNCLKVSNGTVRLSKIAGRRLIALGTIYLFVMIARYTMRMAMFPTERWTGGSMPIFFHLVLASFLVVLGLLHLRYATDTKKSSTAAKFAWGSIYGIIGLFITAWLAYQLAPAILAHKLMLRGSQYSVAIQKKAQVALTDGTVLLADIYHPEKLLPAPTILVRIPLDDNLKGSVMSNIIGRLWAERGYNVVVQGVRGKFGAKGNHIPFMHEREDGIATLHWLNKQPWHNGKTAMWGGSYFGYTQWVLADQDSLGLKALFTQISSSSNYAMLYPGHTLSYESALFWATRSAGKEDNPFSYEQLKKGYDGAPLIKADDRVIKDIPFFDDWVEHEQKDDFWKSVDGEARAKSITVPLLSMAGWFDPYLISQLSDFETISRGTNSAVAEKSRLIVGPWAHAETVMMPNGYQDANYRLSSIAPSIDWFDANLKEIQPTHSSRVKIFVMGTNQWRDEESFPLARTKYTPYFLSNQAQQPTLGELTPNPPSYDSMQVSFVFDPANPVPSIGGAVLGERAGMKNQNEIENRSDVLLFTSSEIKNDLEVTGKVTLKLLVKTDAITTDFTAKLCDVYPDGSSYNLSEGILRKNYQSNNHPEQIEIELNPTSNVFLKGHRIRLLVSSSSYPRYSLNYGTRQENYEAISGSKAKQKIFTGKILASRLILPLIPATRR